MGIFGGTFNPVHLGHLVAAQDACDQARLDRVLFVPAAQPPHKPLTGNVTGPQRLQMLRRAIAGDERFAVDDLELRRGGVSFAIDTVRELRRRYPDVTWYFILGGDSLAELPSWREAPALVRLCRFIAVGRPGFRPRPLRRLTGLRYQWIQTHPCEISSRDIRARVAAGQSVRYLVPEPVRHYLERQKLYR
jgi:nicotinate-nucleotide adenylyltransferase